MDESPDSGVVGHVGHPPVALSPITTRRGQRQRKARKTKQPPGWVMEPPQELALDLAAVLHEWRSDAGDGRALPGDDQYFVRTVCSGKVPTVRGETFVMLESLVPRGIEGLVTGAVAVQLRIRIFPCEHGARETVYSAELGAAVFSMIEQYFAMRHCLQPLRPDPEG